MSIQKTLLAVGVALAGTMANAAITYGTQHSDTAYVGIKVGQADVDLAKNAIAYGVYGGYHYDHNLGVEAEYITSQDKKYGVDAQTREYSVSSLAGYGTYRYHFFNTPFYAKAKLGLAKTKVEINAVDGASYINNSDKLGLGYGVGAGYQNGSLGVEAGFSKAGDMKLLGVGVNMAFQ